MAISVAARAVASELGEDGQVHFADDAKTLATLQLTAPEVTSFVLAR